MSWPEDPLARLALSAAWRTRAFAHGLAHGLRRLPGGEPQRIVLERVARLLDASDAFTRELGEHWSGDPERLVQARLAKEPLPSPESWAEVAVAELVMGCALKDAAAGLAGSSRPLLAEGAALVPVRAPAFGDLLRELAADPPNRGCLDILVDRWLPSAVMTFGRPGSPHEERLLREGVKTRAAADSLSGFLRSTDTLLASLGVKAPDAARMAVDVPDGWTPISRSAVRRAED